MSGVNVLDGYLFFAGEGAVMTVADAWPVSRRVYFAVVAALIFVSGYLVGRRVVRMH